MRVVPMPAPICRGSARSHPLQDGYQDADNAGDRGGDGPEHHLVVTAGVQGLPSPVLLVEPGFNLGPRGLGISPPPISTADCSPAPTQLSLAISSRTLAAPRRSVPRASGDRDRCRPRRPSERAGCKGGVAGASPNLMHGFVRADMGEVGDGPRHPQPDLLTTAVAAIQPAFRTGVRFKIGIAAIALNHQSRTTPDIQVASHRHPPWSDERAGGMFQWARPAMY